MNLQRFQGLNLNQSTTAIYLSKPRCLGCTLPRFCATCSGQLCHSCRSGKRINSDYNDPVKGIGIETTRNWEFTSSWLNLFVFCLVNSLLVICCRTRSWSSTRKSCRFPKTKVDPFHFCTIGVWGWFWALAFQSDRPQTVVTNFVVFESNIRWVKSQFDHALVWLRIPCQNHRIPRTPSTHESGFVPITRAGNLYQKNMSSDEKKLWKQASLVSKHAHLSYVQKP